jgi:hypothetical protein
MATEQPHAVAAPPIEVVVSEVFATLAFAAHAYLGDADAEKSEANLAGAEMAIDLAGRAFERVEPRLSTGERAAMASMLTDLRMTYVRKRG